MLAFIIISLIFIFLLAALLQHTYRFNSLKKIITEQSEQIHAFKNQRENFAIEMTKARQNAGADMIDSNSGLFTLQAFTSQFNNLISQSRKSKNIFALVMIDLNQFKNASTPISDAMKEKVLVEIAHRLQKTIREADFASYAGNNIYLTLLPNLQKPEMIVHAVERIIHEIHLPHEIEGKTIEVNVVAGISIYPFDGEDKNTLQENAGIALNRARQSGKNVFQFYQNETQALGERELTLKSVIRDADFLKHLMLEYKPYYNIQNNKIAFIEVAASLQHPELGIIPFSELSRLSHYSSKLFELYDWMIESTIVKFNLTSNGSPTPMQFIFSFTPKQFETPHFLEKIIALTNKLTSERCKILMEIRDDEVENANLGLFRNTILKLNEANIPIVIGILVLGHFAMNKLNQVHFDYLKIDEKLVKNLGSHGESQSILERIMLLAGSLHIETLTNGVDTEEQKTILKNLGCNTIQGKIFKQMASDEGFFIES